jgi:WS/DGAT/MGAT family acyltransferase
MAPVDAAWLHMDRRTNRMVVTSVMWLDEAVDFDTFRALLQQRLVDRFPHFSQRVVDRTTSVWWEDADDFRLDDHLHRASLEPPGDPAQLHRFVSELLDRPLDRRRPLWEIHLVDGYRGSGGAVVSRMHHCIADGVALARVMMSLTDDPDGAEAAGLAGEPVPAHGAAAAVGHAARRLVAAGLQPVTSARSGAAAAVSLTRLVTLPPDHRTALHGAVGPAKRVVWSEPVPVDRLRAAAHAHGVTVNDLVLSAMAGALRGHLARTDGRAHDVRAVVPVNVRPLDRPLPVELGNAFGLLYVPLPVSVDDPVERLARIHRSTGAAKYSPDPVVSYGLLRLTGRLPYEAEQVVVDLFASKASVVITNVPGPRRPVYLAGRRVAGTIGWPPESGRLGLGLAIISYAGGLVVGALADERLIGDPARIVEDTGRCLAELVERAGRPVG